MGQNIFCLYVLPHAHTEAGQVKLVLDGYMEDARHKYAPFGAMINLYKV